MKRSYLQFLEILSVIVCLMISIFWLMIFIGTMWGSLKLIESVLFWIMPIEVFLIIVEIKGKTRKLNVLRIFFTIFTMLLINYLPSPFAYGLFFYFVLMISKFAITSTDKV